MTRFNLTYFDFYQAMLILIILTVGLVICTLASSRDVHSIKTTIALYIWHTFFSIIFFIYTVKTPADSTTYFLKTFDFQLTSFPSPGTRFTEALTYIISTSLDANYLNTTLVFNSFGALGLTLLNLSLRKYLTKLNPLWILIVFIPSMSFWSSGVGKDSISFMATCLFLYGIVQSKRPKFSLSVAFVAMFMVRPHIAAIMLFSFVIYFILKSKTHIVLKTLLIPVISVGVLITLQFVQQYVGLDDASLESLDQYVDKRQGYNQGGGSSLDISSMSYPMQMFTYIFRPLPFEAHSAVALITSLENTALLLVFLYILFQSKSSFKTFFRNENLWLFMYIFLTCTILALTTANLGIATRQKWMFMPILIYLLVYAFHDYKTKNNKVYS